MDKKSCKVGRTDENPFKIIKFRQKEKFLFVCMFSSSPLFVMREKSSQENQIVDLQPAIDLIGISLTCPAGDKAKVGAKGRFIP